MARHCRYTLRRSLTARRRRDLDIRLVLGDVAPGAIAALRFGAAGAASSSAVVMGALAECFRDPGAFASSAAASEPGAAPPRRRRRLLGLLRRFLLLPLLHELLHVNIVLLLGELLAELVLIYFIALRLQYIV